MGSPFYCYLNLCIAICHFGYIILSPSCLACRQTCCFVLFLFIAINTLASSSSLGHWTQTLYWYLSIQCKYFSTQELTLLKNVTLIRGLWPLSTISSTNTDNISDYLIMGVAVPKRKGIRTSWPRLSPERAICNASDRCLPRSQK